MKSFEPLVEGDGKNIVNAFEIFNKIGAILKGIDIGLKENKEPNDSKTFISEYIPSIFREVKLNNKYNLLYGFDYDKETQDFAFSIEIAPIDDSDRSLKKFEDKLKGKGYNPKLESFEEGSYISILFPIDEEFLKEEDYKWQKRKIEEFIKGAVKDFKEIGLI